jgi:hypothetical protein
VNRRNVPPGYNVEPLGARDFYLKHSFRPLPAQSDRLFPAMKEIEKMFEK